ncbi:MAG: endolytic transglycosylase MltG, partial [Pseudomonadota bacterium]
MRHVAANAITVLIVFGLVLAAVVGWGVSAYRAPGPHAEAVEVSIPRGATLNRAATLAEEAGVIADARLFRIGARYQGLAERIQAGEFEIPAGASAEDVLRCFVDQSTCERVSYDVAVIEGMTSWEVVQRLNGIEELTGEIAEIPPEGSLAPDTYGAQRGDDRNALIARMTAAQETRLAEAWAARAEGLP